MKNNPRSWALTGVLFAVACAFTIFSGISIADMVKPDEPTIASESENESDTEAPSYEEPETLAPASSEEPETETAETESVPEETTTEEAPPETAAPQENASYRTLTEEELQNIAASYDGTLKNFYSSRDTDETNRPICCNNLYQDLISKFSAVSVYNNADSATAALCFILTIEYDDNTSNLLNVLANYGVKATFFVDQNYCEHNPGVISRIINEGHELASLGATFPSNGLASLPLANQMNDIAAFHEYIQNAYGYSMSKLYYGYDVYSDQAVALANAMGYRVCFYSINYVDYDHNAAIDANAFLQDMQTRLHYGAIYSFHTTNIASVNIMAGLIEHIQAQGYTITLIQ